MSAVRVSVVLPFRDHEDKIGRACLNLAEYFRNKRQDFEIIAVDQGSGDNSRSVLALLRHDLPELIVTMGGGYAAGSRKAQAGLLVLTNVENAASGVDRAVCSALDWIEQGEIDIYLATETVLVCQKQRCQRLLRSGTSRRRQSERQIFDRACRKGLSVRSYRPLSHRPSAHRPSRVLSRLLASVMPGHFASHRGSSVL